MFTQFGKKKFPMTATSAKSKELAKTSFLNVIAGKDVFSISVSRLAAIFDLCSSERCLKDLIIPVFR